ncbi:histidinol-phosphatase HisJ [Lysinibacillus capsici]|uniref:histidinol-phosphatase HisJ n=1 Tax=Lysinibacillus TaxID=400634 RepID=UPI0006539388|nr:MULTISPECIES: histidinol-phosphatase HisJ [Lysinibacillus]KMN39140.1 histidinol phosphatase [Lysinibacillus sp. LK3]MEC1302630.1 histidinol-phosphatase HisJ [Lysinibacillus capsici]MED3797683.1 histidinol-phosphatase HisJ [Lysinibacillus capsici]MED4551785.1 histidinol-phosphatase HisJ [Lysinibacillus capsici]WPK04383.1 histidinol-phosphatase HisJ [Lysinibacillus capsici]
MKRDGHIHSPFCPHGTTDSFKQYIEKAISQHFTDITFTEHAPLPKSFVDPTPQQDSGMNPDDLMSYIEELQHLQQQYAQDIRIRIGLEVDYIQGYEQETRQFLDTYGHLLDDAILSVHFLKWQDTFVCIDFSSECFIDFSKKVGSVELLYDLYYDTVLQSIRADLGPYKPKRIGHPSLIHKFQLAHNEKINDTPRIKEVLDSMKFAGYELDLNSAGLSKQYCQEPYPPFALINYSQTIKLPYVFGSDAHCAEDLHQHYNVILPI